MPDSPRIAILGAGPIGLEAALYARYLGYQVQLFERGQAAAANVLCWGHVSLFTPFGMNASPLGIAAVEAQDPSWHSPAAQERLTATEMAHRYWLPLANSDLVAGVLRCETEVLAIGRQGWLKRDGVGDANRGAAPFSLLLRHADGTEDVALAEVVIDCTGTYGNHNWLGQGGVPAPGESAAAERIEYGLPDVAGADKKSYFGKHTLVVGAGYSAATVVTHLSELPADTRVTWITRDQSRAPIQRIEGDRLDARDALAEQANQLAAGETANVTHHAATTIAAVEYRAESDDFEVELTGQQHGKFVFDRIIANLGYRPDNRIYSELQVHECYASGGPMKLAAQLLAQAGNSADCLDQSSCGPPSLLNPEPHFYILGSKSYGRGSNFLLSIGLEQIRDVFTIIGEREDLDLYATMPALR
ncbi:MAG: NAD-binding protein [Bythopirellula sp.]